MGDKNMRIEAIRRNQQIIKMLDEVIPRCQEAFSFAREATIPEGLDFYAKQDAEYEKEMELAQRWEPAAEIVSQLEVLGSSMTFSGEAIARLMDVIRGLQPISKQCTEEVRQVVGWDPLFYFCSGNLQPLIEQLQRLHKQQKRKMKEFRHRFETSQVGGSVQSYRGGDAVFPYVAFTEWLLRDAYQGVIQSAINTARAAMDWDRTNALSQIMLLPLHDIPGKLAEFGIDAGGMEKAVLGIGDEEGQGGDDSCRDAREKLRKWLLGKEWQLNWDMMHAGPSGYSPDDILAAQSDPAVAARKGQLAAELEAVRDQLDALAGMSCEQVKKLMAHYHVDAGWDGVEEDSSSEPDEEPDVEPAGGSGGKPPSIEDMIADLARLEADGKLPTLEDLLEQSEDMVKALDNDEISEEEWRHFQHRLHQRYRLDAYRSPNRVLRLPSMGQAMAQLMPDGTLSVFEGKQTESEYVTYEYWVYPDGTYISRDSMAREDSESGEAFQTVAIVAHPSEGKDVVLAESTYRVGEKAPTLEGLLAGSELPQELRQLKKNHPYGPW